MIILMIGNLIISWNFNLAAFSFYYKIDPSGLILSVILIFLLVLMHLDNNESLKILKYIVILIIGFVAFIETQIPSYRLIFEYYLHNPNNFITLGQFTCCVFPQNPLLSYLSVNFSEIIYISLAILLLFLGIVKQQDLDSKLVCFNCGSKISNLGTCSVCNFEQLSTERQKDFNTYQDIIENQIDRQITDLMTSIVSLLIFVDVISSSSILSGFFDFSTNLLILLILIILVKLVNDGYKTIQLIKRKSLSYNVIESNKVIQLEFQSYERTLRLNRMYKPELGSKKTGLQLILVSFILLSLPIIDLVYNLPNFSTSVQGLFYNVIPTSGVSCGGYVGFSFNILMFFFLTNLLFSLGIVMTDINLKRREKIAEKKIFGRELLFIASYYVLLALPLMIMILYGIPTRNFEPVLGIFSYETITTIALIYLFTKANNFYKKFGYLLGLLAIIIFMGFLIPLPFVFC